MDHLATTQGIYEAFGRGDVPAILDALADDVAWDVDAPSHGIPIYESGTGKAAAAGFFTALGDLDITVFAPRNFLAGGDQVAAVFDVAATVQATGKSFEVVEIHLWTFGPDGKVTRFFHGIDRHAVWLAYQAG